MSLQTLIRILLLLSCTDLRDIRLLLIIYKFTFSATFIMADVNSFRCKLYILHHVQTTEVHKVFPLPSFFCIVSIHFQVPSLPTFLQKKYSVKVRRRNTQYPQKCILPPVFLRQISPSRNPCTFMQQSTLPSTFSTKSMSEKLRKVFLLFMMCWKVLDGIYTSLGKNFANMKYLSVRGHIFAFICSIRQH